MRLIPVMRLTVLSVLSALTAGAITIVTPGSFQPFPATLTEKGLSSAPYWDNPSLDGPRRNIGFYLTGLTTLPNSPNLVNPSYLGAGFNPVDFSFTASSPIALTLLLASTGNVDEFGYYNSANPGQSVALFTTSTPLTTTVVFTPGFSSFGFYIKYLPGTVGLLGFSDMFRSQASLNSGSEASQLTLSAQSPHQHFALFAAGSGFYLGVTDHWGTPSIVTAGAGVNELLGDYQDFVVRIQDVPEPAALLMMLCGVGIMFGMRRRSPAPR